jgi:hypothetical protein
MRSHIFAFLLIFTALFLNSCRTDKPPAISIICTLDGLGGADCVQIPNKQVHLAPSQLAGYWATTQADIANFSSWCYQVPTPIVSSEMSRINEKIFARRIGADTMPEPMVEPQIIWDQRGDHAE